MVFPSVVDVGEKEVHRILLRMERHPAVSINLNLRGPIWTRFERACGMGNSLCGCQEEPMRGLWYS